MLTNMEVAKQHGGGDPNKIVGLAGDLDENAVAHIKKSLAKKKLARLNERLC